MTVEAKSQRFQLGLLAAFVVLALLYWFGYRALWKRSAELDLPLAALQKQLAGSGNPSSDRLAVDLIAMSNRVSRLEDALHGFRQSADHALSRIEPDPEVRVKIREAFQIFEFEKSRVQLVAELKDLATRQNVALSPEILSGYPDFVGEVANPSLLWAQMSLVHQILASAVVQQPRAVSGLRLLPARSHVAARQIALEEFPIRLEMFGTMEAISGFLQTLPLRGEELAGHGQREVPGSKQALFVERMILKTSAHSPNELHLDIVVSGLIRRS
jgi:hypothetical protein